MKRTNPSVQLLILLPLFALFMTGCRSTVDPYELDLTPGEYFQKAIDASDSGNYKLALRYYEAFQQKYPEDLSGNLWASYEIALCYHKMGRNKTAAELFRTLLDQYDKIAQETKEDAADKEPVPLGPRILAEKVLQRIEPKPGKEPPKEK
ncbi:MAG TPA: tetratricopeptide repeat protein [Spirochaetia bacterium]|nr:tetratricopeptide repeat protein [Spirochaetia bacterium]